MIGKIFDRARKPSIKSISGGTYGSWLGGNQMLFNASGLDLDREAGVRYDNSIVYAILAFAARHVNSVPLRCVVYESGKVRVIENHPAVKLLNNPNPWYDGTLLATGQVFGEASRGNSYTYKHRSKGGRLVALEFMPEGSTYPFTYPGSGDWISEYRIQSASGFYRVPTADILQLRWMTINPFWPQLGMSPVESCLPELVADKKANSMEACLLNNSGVTPQAIFPKTFPDDVDIEITEAQREQIADKIEAGITGGNVGRPLVFNIPMDIQKLGFDPSQLLMKETHMQSEGRICGVFNIPPVVLPLPIGLEFSNNRASMEAAVDFAFDNFLIPYLRHRGKQFTEDLIPELGQPGEHIEYDEAHIPPIRGRLIRELMIQTGSPLLTPNEGRSYMGLKAVPNGDTLRETKSSIKTEEPLDA